VVWAEVESREESAFHSAVTTFDGPMESKLQRVGLIPDVEVHPTIAGIRAGKDEVLDRALEYLKDSR
jgi:hypothetical protein